VYTPSQCIEVLKELHRPEVWDTSIPSVFKVQPDPAQSKPEEAGAKDGAPKEKKGMFWKK
jgi:hypothetical protein